MRGTFGSLDSRQKERMRLALIETLSAHYASPPFFDPRQGTERTHPLDRPSLEAIAHFVNSVNFSALDALDVASGEARRFFEGVLLRYLDVNAAFKKPRFARYMPALRARAPRLAADVHRGLLASLDGKAANFGMGVPRRTWTEGRERARKIPQDEYERSSRILEAAIIRSRIDDYTNTGFVPQVEPADVARRPQSAPARPAQPDEQWPVAGATANDLTVPVSATGFAAAFNALGMTATNAPPRNAPPFASEQPTDQVLGASAPRELPNDLYELYGDYLQDMQPDTAVTPSVRSAPPPAYDQPMNGQRPPAPWQSAPAASSQPQFGPPIPPAAARPPQPSAADRQPNAASHNDLMVFWQLRYQLEAYVRRAAESYGLSYNGSDPSTVLDALRQSGFVDEADLRIAEGILALTDRVTRSTAVSMEDYRQAFLLYLLYHRSHLGI